MSMIGTSRALLAALVLMGATGIAAAQSFTQPGAGKPLFDGLCQDCHGLNGTGDEGPALNHPLGADDATLHKIIRDGIPERGMPRVRRMTEEEVDVLVSYVKSLGSVGPAKVVGNAEKGRAVYQRLACATCHVVNGQGGVLGPELTKIGQRRAPNYLREALLDPAKMRPKGVQGILQNGFTEYLPVSIVENNGRETRGIRVNEDSFTIQVRDANGKFYSFRKSQLTNVDKQFNRSMMPSYKDRLNAADTADLVAYLFSLGGAK
jgi:putative heme-binding domain-containing protein